MGSPEFMLSILFYTRWGNIRLANCFCGIARSLVPYCVSKALGQYQTNEFNCFCGVGRFHFSIVFYLNCGSIRPKTASVGLPKFMSPLSFSTHRGNIRLKNWFCWIARIHVSIALYTHWANIRPTKCLRRSAHIYDS